MSERTISTSEYIEQIVATNTRLRRELERVQTLELPMLRGRVQELENLILDVCNADGDYIKLWKEAVSIKTVRELVSQSTPPALNALEEPGGVILNGKLTE